MAQLRDLKILPGGLNLTAPGDQVPTGDSLDLTGWWPGSAGRLEQAPGWTQRAAAAGFDIVDSLLQADGRLYYGGATKLYQQGRAAGAAIDTGYSADPLAMISFQGFAWIMNPTLQRKDDGTTASAWSPTVPVDPPTAVEAGGGALTAGDYSIYTTWESAEGHESNPGPELAFTVVTDGDLLTITRPAEAGHYGWNVYVKTPRMSQPYRINENVKLYATTDVVYDGLESNLQDDDFLIAERPAMETDHDPAPGAKVIANQIYNGRIVVANSSSYPNRIWYTPALRPYFFPGSTSNQTGNWVDVGTDRGDAIYAIIVKPGQLVVYRSKSIWRVTLDFEDEGSRIEPVVPDLGTVGVRAVVSTSLGDYFVGREAVYRFNGDWADPMSWELDPIFRAQDTENFFALGTSYISQCALGHRSGRLWFSYPNSSGNQQTLVYHLGTKRWFANSISARAYLDIGTAFVCCDGPAGPYVKTLETGLVDGPGNTVLAYQTAYEDCGRPDREKTWSDLVLDHRTGAQAWTVTARTNKKRAATDTFTVATLTSSTLTRETVPLVYPAGYSVVALRGKPIRSRDLSIRVAGVGPSSGSPAVLESPILLHYYLEPRRAKRFDTDETDMGLPHLTKFVYEVEYDIETTGAWTQEIWSDVPGYEMALRTTATSSTTVGRQIVQAAIGGRVRGHLLRFVIATDYEFLLYGFRVRVLPVGLYLDGVYGETWQPEPLAIGV